MMSDEMNHPITLLYMPHHTQQHRLPHNRPLLFAEARPDHHVNEAALVLESDEGDARRRHRSLPTGNETGPLGTGLVIKRSEIARGRHLKMIQMLAKQRQWMPPQGETGGGVIADDVLTLTGHR
jgi:hypothetical protein